MSELEIMLLVLAAVGNVAYFIEQRAHQKTLDSWKNTIDQWGETIGRCGELRQELADAKRRR